MSACPQCGHETEADARFCAACGAPVRDLTSTTTIPVLLARPEDAAGAGGPDHDLPSGVTALIVDRGPDAGTRFLLVPSPEGTLSVGRDATSDIFLDDVTVSRTHATLQQQDATWLIQDSGSLNGTYVNGVRCREQLLRAGDVVNIGKFRFQVAVGSES